MAVTMAPARRPQVVQRRNYGRNHSYTVEGRWAPGVTTILSATTAKPALTGWAARMVAEYVADKDAEWLEGLRRDGREALVDHLKGIPSRTTSAAGVRGTAVHRMAERVIAGEEIEETPETQPLWGHIESCVAFLNDWRVAPVIVEGVIGDPVHRYAGTFDLIADLPDARRALFDYKTSASGIFPETALQLAAYQHAEFYMDGADEKLMADLNISAAYAVHLRADGYDVYPLETEPAWATFKHLAAAYHLAFAPAAKGSQRKVMDSWVGEPESWSAVAA